MLKVGEKDLSIPKLANKRKTKRKGIRQRRKPTKDALRSIPNKKISDPWTNMR